MVGRWIPWSESNFVPFSGTNGQGNGERRVLQELALWGSPAFSSRGPPDSWDFEILQTSTRWEVKDVTNSLEFRTGKSGASAVAPLVHEFQSCVGVLLGRLSLLGPPSDLEEGVPWDHMVLWQRRGFLLDALRRASEGSIPRGLVFGGTRDHPEGVLDVLRVIGRGPEADRLEKIWNDVDPLDAMEGVSGFVFVHESDGFLFMKSKDVPGRVEFTRVSQGRPKFRMVRTD